MESVPGSDVDITGSEKVTPRPGAGTTPGDGPKDRNRASLYLLRTTAQGILRSRLSCIRSRTRTGRTMRSRMMIRASRIYLLMSAGL